MSAAADVRMFQDDILNNPRKHLTGSEITHLRKLDAGKVAIKARGGWVCQGTWYKEATFKRFVALGLASETFFNGHKVQLNARGRTVVALLAQRTTHKAG